MTKQTGVALVFVLLLLVVLMLMAGGFTATMRSDAALAYNQKQRLRGDALADAAIAYAQFMMARPDSLSRWPADARTYAVQFDGYTTSVTVQDETGRLDLNRIDRTLLLSVLKPLVADSGIASGLADRILAGPVAVAMSGQGISLVADSEKRRKRYASVRGLLRIEGMSGALYTKLAPLFTVHSQEDRVDLGVAPEPVLAALPGSSPNWVAQVLSSRNEATPRIAPAAIPSEMTNYVSGKTPQRGRFFSITVNMPDIGGVVYVKKVILRRNLQRAFPPFQELEQTLETVPARIDGSGLIE